MLVLVITMGLAAFAQEPAAAALPPDAFAAQLRTCREGNLDPQAPPEDRRRWVQLLLTFKSPEADNLVLELLNPAHRPEVQRAVCSELSAVLRSDPLRANPEFVEPLIRLLGSESVELRAAAAKALSEYQDGEVAVLLGRLASDSAATLPARLAAISALAANTHRRDVVEQLVPLLRLGVPEISEQAAAAIEPIAPQGFGTDFEKWNDWLSAKKDLGPEAWLSEQVRIYRDRLRRVQTDLALSQSDRERESAAAHSRIREFQREILRGLSSEQRAAKLVEWIDDPLAIVRLAALSIVKSRIADEGKRPEGALLASLVSLLQNEQVVVRREALDILQNLRDRSVVEAVLAQLERESDASLRLAMLDALGKLGDSVAVDALIREISGPISDPRGIREAANALGQIAARTRTGPSSEQGSESSISGQPTVQFQPAVEPLRRRYGEMAAEQLPVRAAILRAMAGVADSSFNAEFLQAIEEDSPTVLEPAVRGLATIKDTTKIARIRTLCSHADPRVRLAAVEAIGVLGNHDDDLAVLQNRLTPPLESNELVRQAAWKGWQTIVAGRPIADRVRAAERLRDFSQLETEYLRNLAQTLATTSNHTTSLQTVRERLVTILTSAGKYGEAVPYLRELFDGYTARSDAAAWPTGLRLLEAILQTPGQQGLAELIQRLSQSAQGDSQKAKIVETVRKYVDSPAMATNPDRARRLRADLGTIEPSTVGDGWTDLLSILDARLSAAGTNGPAG